MNVHFCPECGHGFWGRGNLGEETPLPRHVRSGRVASRAVSLLTCPGSNQPAVNVKPKGAS